MSDWKLARVRRKAEFREREEKRRKRLLVEEEEEEHGHSFRTEASLSWSQSSSSATASSSQSNNNNKQRSCSKPQQRNEESSTPKTNNQNVPKIMPTTPLDLIRRNSSSDSKKKLFGSPIIVDKRWLDPPKQEERKPAPKKILDFSMNENPPADGKVASSKPLSPPAKDDSSDDDDDDFDFLAEFKKLKEKSADDNGKKSSSDKVVVPPGKDLAQQNHDQQEPTDPSDSCLTTELFQSESLLSEYRQVKQQQNVQDNNDGESTAVSSENHPGESSRRSATVVESNQRDSNDRKNEISRRKLSHSESPGGPMSISAAQSPASPARRSLDKSLMDDSSDDDEKASKKSSSRCRNTNEIPHNPIALMNRQQLSVNNTNESPPAQRTTTTTTTTTNASLWSDSENEQEESQMDTNKKKRKKAPCTKKKSAPRKKSRDFLDHAYDSLEEDDEERLLDLDDKSLQGQLHPQFEDPHFGPYELVPLELEGDNGQRHQVPASLSRYLAPFQQEGVRFMHKCLTAKTGVILGDDMVSRDTAQATTLNYSMSNRLNRVHMFPIAGCRKDSPSS
jgi:hypothetical protein